MNDSKKIYLTKKCKRWWTNCKNVGILIDKSLNKHMKIWCTNNVYQCCEFEKAIETPVARQVPYGEPDYRDTRPTNFLTGWEMGTNGKRRISARKQADGGQKKSN